MLPDKLTKQLKDYQSELLDDFEGFLDGSPAKAFANSTKAWLGFAAPYRPLPTTENNPAAEDTPFVCLRVPTGGGKTFLAAHAIQRVTRSYLPSEYALTLWLVPTEAIRTQTLRVLKDPESPAQQSMSIERILNQPLIDDGPKQVGDTQACAPTGRRETKTAKIRICELVAGGVILSDAR